MSTPTLILGNNKWAIKEDSILGYAVEDRNGLYLPREISFTRASNGTRINSAGLVEVTPWNLFQQSEDFSNAAWTKTNTTVTSNLITAPNGTLTADLIVPANATDGVIVQASLSFIVGTSYSLSVYGKKEDFNFLLLALPSAAFPTSNRVALFDLNNGTIASSTQSGTGAVISDVGNGWYRCSITITATTTTSSTVVIAARSSNNLTSLGNGTDGIFVWGAQLNIGSTAKPYFQTTDRLNVPRLTYQNGGGGYPSLLLEPQRTNLAVNSEIWNGTGWIAEGATVTANTVISPSGYQDADTLTGTDSFPRLRQNFTLADNTEYAISSFLKAGTAYSVLIIFVNKAGTSIFYRFNLQNGTAQSGAKIENYGNGWYRCSFTANSGIGATTPTVRFASNDFGTTGGWTNGLTIYAWGAQMEQGAYPTTYIPTTSSSATRVADACFKTGISSLIGQTEGVLFAEIRIESGSTEFRVISINDGSISNRVVLAINGQTDIRGFVVYGSTVGTAITTSIPSGAIKIAIVYTATNYTFFVNGSKIGTQTKGSFATTLTNLSFDQGNGGNSFFGQDKQLILFPTPLTDAELASLTTL